MFYALRLDLVRASSEAIGMWQVGRVAATWEVTLPIRLFSPKGKGTLAKCERNGGREYAAYRRSLNGNCKWLGVAMNTEFVPHSACHSPISTVIGEQLANGPAKHHFRNAQLSVRSKSKRDCFVFFSLPIALPISLPISLSVFGAKSICKRESEVAAVKIPQECKMEKVHTHTHTIGQPSSPALHTATLSS